MIAMFFCYLVFGVISLLFIEVLLFVCRFFGVVRFFFSTEVTVSGGDVLGRGRRVKYFLSGGVFYLASYFLRVLSFRYSSVVFFWIFFCL